jgi:hypothetical protein
MRGVVEIKQDHDTLFRAVAHSLALKHDYGVLSNSRVKSAIATLRAKVIEFVETHPQVLLRDEVFLRWYRSRGAYAAPTTANAQEFFKLWKMSLATTRGGMFELGVMARVVGPIDIYEGTKTAHRYRTTIVGVDEERFSTPSPDRIAILRGPNDAYHAMRPMTGTDAHAVMHSPPSSPYAHHHHHHRHAYAPYAYPAYPSYPSYHHHHAPPSPYTPYAAPSSYTPYTAPSPYTPYAAPSPRMGGFGGPHHLDDLKKAYEEHFKRGAILRSIERLGFHVGDHGRYTHVPVDHLVDARNALYKNREDDAKFKANWNKAEAAALTAAKMHRASLVR